MSTLLYGRCNPYGAESGGPRRLMGGLYGGKSARTPGMFLPQNVEEGEWSCPQPAAVRVRMTCPVGHVGQIMELCSWHDETVFSGEYFQGQFRQITHTIRSKGHLEMIQERQAGVCPRCCYPNSKNLYPLSQDPRLWYGTLAASLRQRREDIGRMFDEANQRGIIKKNPLQLVAVS
jgi:hypothetical protein